MKKILLLLLWAWASAAIANAEEKIEGNVIEKANEKIDGVSNERVTVNLQGDIVSSYVWRGMYQSGAAFQPGFGFSAGGFSLATWGSVDFTGQGHKEADITLAYSVAGLTVSVADLWWAGQSGIKNSNTNGQNKYFNFEAGKTDHIIEAGLSYTLPIEKFPLSISWYTMFWGADKITAEDCTSRQAYSSYFELAYPFSAKSLDFVASIGGSPWKSGQYLNNDFAITNISLKATARLKLTESFTLPLFVQTSWNPDRQDVHFICGLTFALNH